MQPDPKTEFKHIVERIQYPEDTKIILEAVRTHGNGDAVIDIARQLPEKTFQNADEVLAEIE